ncbi:30S ribosomal protein S11 [Patescibacteria group bacterium]|nr:30S ribosomal protein S11 [Patescibacteria group bacterium]
MPEEKTKTSGEAKQPTPKKKRKKRASITSGLVYIQSTFNNTLITITDKKGDTLSWGSAGQAGFKGTKKSTPFAASIAAKNAAGKAKQYGLKEVDIFVQGIGSGRESSIRALYSEGINILSIKDITPLPHNGCRSKKPRRV